MEGRQGLGQEPEISETSAWGVAMDWRVAEGGERGQDASGGPSS